MRTREKIEEGIKKAVNTRSSEKMKVAAILNCVELLLDIRELLQNPPVEITGSPIVDEN